MQLGRITFLFLQMILLETYADTDKENFNIQSVRGAAFCGSKALNKGDMITVGCEILTHARSNLYLVRGGDIIVFGENAKAMIQESSKIDLVSGMIRLKIKNKIVIKTPESLISLNSGDYMTKTSELMGETEAINFTGELKLASISEPNDFVTIYSGHWGGIGGRFNNKIGDLLKLNEKQKSVLSVVLD